MKIVGIRNIKGNHKFTKKREEENKKEEYEIGCFQLVVIDKTPWYKKVIRFFKKICLKEITIKV